MRVLLEKLLRCVASTSEMIKKLKKREKISLWSVEQPSFTSLTAAHSALVDH